MPMKDVSNEEQSNLFLSGSVHREAIKLTDHDNHLEVVSPPQLAEDLRQQDPDQERMEEEELVGSVTKNLQV